MTVSAKSAFRAKMRALWHGEWPAARIVRYYGRSYRTAFGGVFVVQRLNEIWSAAQDSGDLPAGSRPHFARFCEVVAADDDDDFAEIDVRDGKTGSRALLAALTREHGRDRLRGVNDEMPLQTLAREIKTPPGRLRVRDFARGRDAYACAKGIKGMTTGVGR